MQLLYLAGLLQQAAFAQASMTTLPPPKVGADSVQIAQKESLSPAIPNSGRHSDFLKHFQAESFGFGPGPQPLGYEFSPGYMASFYHVEGLECPNCVLGAPNRTRFTLPPFGANVIYKLWNDKVEVFGLGGGRDASNSLLTPRLIGHRLLSATYEQSWLVETEGGVRMSLDRAHHISFGGSARESYDPVSNVKKWATFSGSAELRFGKQ